MTLGCGSATPAFVTADAASCSSVGIFLAMTSFFLTARLCTFERNTLCACVRWRMHVHHPKRGIRFKFRELHVRGGDYRSQKRGIQRTAGVLP